MLSILSPAKTLDETVYSQIPLLRPEMERDADHLVEVLRGYDEAQLASLMGVSQKLAQLNVARYQQWNTAARYPALTLFKGDVYEAMKVAEYSQEDWSFAGKHLRILSGLYGVLRPQDGMKPYRLEMGTSLPNEQGKDLYRYWGDRVTNVLNQALQDSGSDIVLNLASTEYSKVVRPPVLRGKWVSVDFKVRKNGKLSVIGLYAKRARGLMADYLIRHRVTDLEGVRSFSAEGYEYDPEQTALSPAKAMVFIKSL